MSFLLLIKKKIYKLSKNKFIKNIFGLNSDNIVFLNYHRIISDEEFINDSRPNNDLVVSETIFYRQIEYLSKNFNIISINDIKYKKTLNNKVVLTFDDGYLDNLEIALPIMEQFNCPATIYVTTSFLDNKNYPWWLKIWNIILYKENLYFNNKQYIIKQFEQKNLIFKKISKNLFSMTLLEIETFLKNLIIENKLELNLNKKYFLNHQQLKKLSKHPLIEIGCHTHYHQNLKEINDDDLVYEITKSKNVLEDILENKIKHFAIPFGTKNAFSKKVLQVISHHKFETIVTTEHGKFDSNKLFRIPRIGIGNLDVDDKLYSKAVGFDSILNKIFFR